MGSGYLLALGPGSGATWGYLALPKASMQIQVNTGKGIEGKEALERWASTELAEMLARFKNDVTRVEVHLSDENSGKAGLDDKRCVMEARSVDHAPQAVTHQGSSMDEAFRGAATKLKHLLEHTLDRQKDHRDRGSIRKDGIVDID